MVEYDPADRALAHERVVPHAAVPREDLDAVCLGAKARVLLGDVVGDDEVEVLLGELGLGVVLDVLRLCGEADEDLVRLLLAELVEDVGVALEHERELPVLLLDLVSRYDLGPVIGDGGRLDDDIRGRELPEHGFAHLPRRLDAHDAHALRHGQSAWRRHQHDIGAAALCLLRDGIAHAARRAVAKVAHGVERLDGAAGRHEYLLARELLPLGEEGSELLYDGGWLRQAPLAADAAGEHAARWLDDVISPCGEVAQVALRHGILVHVRVHRRRGKDRCLCREQGRRQHVVGDAGRCLGKDVGRRGCDQHSVGERGERDVLDMVVRHLGPHVRRHRLATDLAEGQLRDEVLGAARHDDMDLRAGLLQAARDLDGLVGGDAARHTEHDLLAREGACVLLFHRLHLLPCCFLKESYWSISSS